MTKSKDNSNAQERVRPASNNLSLAYSAPLNDHFKREHSTPDDVDLLVVHHVAKTVAQARTGGDAIPSILRVMSEMLGLNRGRVLTPENDKISIRYSYGLTDTEHQRGVYAIGEGVSGKVMRTGQVAVVQDVDDEPDLLFRAVARSTLPQETVSYIAVPVLSGGEPIGVLGCHRLRNRVRSLDADLVVLRILAAFIAKLVKDDQLIEPQGVSPGSQSSNPTTQTERARIIGSSAALQETLTLTRQVADTDVTVLITGESGTGKELFAHLLHTQGGRQDKPFIAINCAAIPEQLLESELFGHERGAFTGAVASKRGKLEAANGGTLFLDEIGDLSLELQAKLLRALETKSIQRVGGLKSFAVDVRLVAATHKDLMQAVNDGRFRMDLFYRLNTFPLALPPLRERPGDITLLVRHFLTQVNAEFGCSAVLNSGVSKRLESYNWPGNIRQLVNVIKRAVLMSDKRAVTVAIIEKILADESRIHGAIPSEPWWPTSEAQGQAPSGQNNASTAVEPVAYSASTASHSASTSSAEFTPTAARRYRWVSDNEREIIQRALVESGGNKTRAAAAVGMTTRQLRYRMQKLGL